MSSIARVILSGSTNGKGIKVAATSTPGTTIHTAVASTTVIDEVWLWAYNSDTNVIKTTVEWGGTTSPDDTVEMYLAPEAGSVLIIPGWSLNNSLVVKAFAGTTNLVMIAGYVNRITP